MFSAFINSFKVKELRKRILYTAGIIILCRIAANIPCPGVNAQNLSKYFDQLADNSQAAGGILDMVNIFSGGALQQFAIGALGIMPYISASIIMQLLTPVLPALEKLKREGEVGYAKINQYTRYLTIAICLIQGAMAAIAMMNPERLSLPRPEAGALVDPNNGIGFILTSVIILTCGTMILMWFGERITEKGLGNGVSLIITINIIERLPQAVQSLISMVSSGETTAGGKFRLAHLFMLLLIFAVVTALTVMLTQGMRRVPIQMAKKTVGNKLTGGNTYMPLKVNFSGVMPIIFAGAIMMFPPMIFQLFDNETVRSWTQYFTHGTYSYLLIYGLLILAFSFFWVANMFNPLQISDNLKKEGAYIPGIRPGKPTADFLDNTMTRVTFAGAIFLTGLAIFPSLLYMWLKIPFDVSSFFGGTSLLIIVGVTIDTLSQMESHLVMKNYDGFLSRGRLHSRSGRGS